MSEMSDQEIRANLRKYNIDVGPISEYTRKTYLNKIEKEMAKENGEKYSASPNGFRKPAIQKSHSTPSSRQTAEHLTFNSNSASFSDTCNKNKRGSIKRVKQSSPPKQQSPPLLRENSDTQRRKRQRKLPVELPDCEVQLDALPPSKRSEKNYRITTGNSTTMDSDANSTISTNASDLSLYQIDNHSLMDRGQSALSPIPEDFHSLNPLTLNNESDASLKPYASPPMHAPFRNINSNVFSHDNQCILSNGFQLNNNNNDDNNNNINNNNNNNNPLFIIPNSNHVHVSSSSGTLSVIADGLSPSISNAIGLNNGYSSNNNNKYSNHNHNQNNNSIYNNNHIRNSFNRDKNHYNHSNHNNDGYNNNNNNNINNNNNNNNSSNNNNNNKISHNNNSNKYNNISHSNNNNNALVPHSNGVVNNKHNSILDEQFQQIHASKNNLYCNKNNNNNRAHWELDPDSFSISKDAKGKNYRLGIGGYCEVYKGIIHKVDEVAIKICKFNQRDTLDLLKGEIDLISVLSHRNILQFYGACITSANIFMVTELMDSDLFTALKQDTSTHWNREHGYNIARDIALGINYLHSRKPIVVHRDLKSANVLLYKYTAKIGDVGIARPMTQVNMTAQSSFTYQWSAPEVLCRERATEKIDIWSYGIIVWEIVTGRVPNSGYLQMPYWVDDDVKNLYMRCTFKDPNLRPSAADIFENLRKLNENNN